MAGFLPARSGVPYALGHKWDMAHSQDIGNESDGYERAKYPRNPETVSGAATFSGYFHLLAAEREDYLAVPMLTETCSRAGDITHKPH